MGRAVRLATARHAVTRSRTRMHSNILNCGTSLDGVQIDSGHYAVIMRRVHDEAARPRHPAFTYQFCVFDDFATSHVKRRCTEISTKRNLLRKSLQFPTPASCRARRKGGSAEEGEESRRERSRGGRGVAAGEESRRERSRGGRGVAEGEESRVGRGRIGVGRLRPPRDSVLRDSGRRMNPFLKRIHVAPRACPTWLRAFSWRGRFCEAASANA